MLILIPAFLQMCECREHGRFVFPDGTKGTEFCSKEAATRELLGLYGGKRISEHEFKFLKSSISETEMPYSDKNSDRMIRIACHIKNEAREIIKEEMEKPDNQSKNLM